MRFFFALFILYSIALVSGSKQPEGLSVEDVETYLTEQPLLVKGSASVLAVALKNAKKPFHSRLIRMDLHDLYFVDGFLESLPKDIINLFVEEVKSLDAVGIASFFFQVDCLIDHTLAATEIVEKSGKLLDLLGLRCYMLRAVRHSYFWSVLEIITQCPSYQIANLRKHPDLAIACIHAYPRLEQKVSITSFLNEVYALSSIPYVDPFEALHLKNAAIALLGSRLGDPDVPVSEIQAWIMALLDNSLWMSIGRIANCLAAMARAGYESDLKALQFHFPLDSWPYASRLLPPCPNRPSFLVTLFTMSTAKDFSEQQKVAISFLNHFVKDEIFGKDAKIDLSKNPSLSSIFNSLPRLRTFIMMTSRDEVDKTQFPKFVTTTLLQSPYYVLYRSDDTLPLTLKNFKPKYASNSNNLSLAKYPHMIYNLAIMVTRNYRTIIIAKRKLATNWPPFVPNNYVVNGATSVFAVYCEHLTQYGVNEANYVEIAKSLELFPADRFSVIMGGFLIDYLISSYIIAQVNIPQEFLNIHGFGSLSQMVAKLRGNYKMLDFQDAKIFFSLVTKMNNLSIISVLLIALLPRAIEDEKYVVEYLDLIPLDFIQEQKLSPSIIRTCRNIAFALHLHCDPKTLNHPFFAKISKSSEIGFEWLSGLSPIAKRRWLQHYLTQIGPCMPLAQGNTDLCCDENDRFYLRDYMKSGEKFDEDRMAKAIAALIIFNLKNRESDILIPESIAEAVLCEKPTSEDQFYELSWLVQFYLSYHVNLSYLSSELRSLLKAKIGSRGVADATFKTDFSLKFRPAKQVEKIEISKKKAKRIDRQNTAKEAKVVSPKFAPKHRNEESAEVKALLVDSDKSDEQKSESHQPFPNSIDNSSDSISDTPERPNAPSRRRAGKVATESSTVPAKFLNSSSAPNTVEAFDSSKCKFTYEFISNNCKIQDNGLVLPKQFSSEQFRKCLTFYLQEGHSLPFKLPHDFFNYITTGRGFAGYSNGESDWNKLPNLSKNLDRMNAWKPKVKPMSVLFETQSPSFNVELRDFLWSLDSLVLARLQSLIFFSTRTGKIGKKGQIMMTIALEPSRSSCAIDSGILIIPQFEDKELLKKQVIELLENDNPLEEKKPKYNDNRKEKSREKSNPAKDKKVKGEKKDERPRIQKKCDGKDVLLQPQKKTKVDICTSSSSLDNVSTNTVTIRPFVFQKTTELESLYTKFDVTLSQILPNKFEAGFNQLKTMISSGLVEYIAIDCEMTGLYTVDDDELHKRDHSTLFKNNTKQLKDGAKVNSVFQLGLVIKTRKGEWSIWSFNTAPQLTKDSFTPSTFKFLFEDPLIGQNSNISSDELTTAISSKLKEISSSSISHEQLASLAALLMNGDHSLIVYSGYADLLYLFKAIGRNVDELDHQVIQTQLSNRIYDLKSVCLAASITGVVGRPSVSAYFTACYSNLKENKHSLHNASFDAVLTAMLYEALKIIRPVELQTAKGLFNFEKRI